MIILLTLYFFCILKFLFILFMHFIYFIYFILITRKFLINTFCKSYLLNEFKHDKFSQFLFEE